MSDSGPGRFYKPTDQEEIFAVVLARIDERTKNTDQVVTGVKQDVASLREQIGKQYVTQQEFKNLVDKVALHQKILFSAISLICLSVLAAVLALVVQRGGH